MFSLRHFSMLVAFLLLSGSLLSANTTHATRLAQESQLATDCTNIWPTVSSRTYSTLGYPTLVDVAALAPNDAWAIGYDNGSASETVSLLALHWDGTFWNRTPVPPIAARHLAGVTGISARATNDVWMVGYDGVEGNVRALILHWDGRTWTRIAEPSTWSTRSSSVLHDVVALAANDAWIVGDAGFAHWNGSTWSAVAVPALSFDDSHSTLLAGMAGTAANDIWAVGFRGGSQTTALTVHWDGTSWSVVPIADSAPESSLSAIVALAPNNAWAVGSDAINSYIVQWDGTSWQRRVTPDPTFGLNQLSAIAGRASNDLWAVGERSDGPFMLHWDGVSWSNAPTEATTQDWNIKGISALPSGDVWVVGERSSGTTSIRQYHFPTITFAQSGYSRSSDGNAPISVALTSPAPYTVTIDYATADDTALAGRDYLATQGTLRIPPCQRSAEFTVPLLAASGWNPTTRAHIRLSNPHGATLGSVATTSFSTTDNRQASNTHFFPLAMMNQAATTNIPGRIMFTAKQQDIYYLYLVNADGTGLQRLTSSTENETDAAWSPNGHQIAFSSTRDSGNGEIYIMNSDGSQVRRLTTNPALDYWPTWSPDGRRIAFVSERTGRRAVFVMNADGSGQKQLTSTPILPLLGYDHPAWSPDGSQIVMEQYADPDSTGPGSTIVRIKPDGSGFKQITTGPYDTFGAWSSDGKQLTVSSVFGTLDVLNADGSGRHEMNPNFLIGGYASWSPDNRYIVSTASLSLMVQEVGSGAYPFLISTNVTGIERPMWQPR